VKLRVWLPPLAELQPDAPLEYEVLDAKRRVRNRGTEVLGALPKGMDCELVLDGVDVVLLDVRLPKMSGAKLARALPGLVEERLAGDMERAHVVAAAPDSAGQSVAAVVDRSALKRALEIFARAGRRVVTVVPQPFALGLSAGRWRVRWREGKGSIRVGVRNGMSLSGGDPPLELRLLVSQSERPPAGIEIDGDCDFGAWSEALGVPVSPAAPATEAPAPPVDLMQYGFARGVVHIEVWRSTFVLGAVLLLVIVGGLNIHAWTLRAQEKSLRESMAAIVKETFPEVPVILDPLAQMRRLTSDLRTGAGTERGGFTAMAVALAQVAEPDSVQSMEFREGRIIVRFRPAFAEGEAKKTALSERAQKAGLKLQFSGETASVSYREAQ
jgi:general secretion pathway protein L